MKVLYIMWEAYGSEALQREFHRRDYEVDEYWLNRREDVYENPRIQQEVIKILSEKQYDFVFSWNYFPIISIACTVCKTPYAAWVYDSPVVSLWHCSIVAPYNYIFIFDKADYLELKRKGINTIYYLPLAAEVERLDGYEMDDTIREIYAAPISFIGSTYTENKYRDYDKINRLDGFWKGYLDGLLLAQQKIYGNLMLEEMLVPELVEKMREAFGVVLREDVGFDFVKYFGQATLPKYITGMERQEILEMLSEKYTCHLYTIKKTPYLPRIVNRGMAGNGKESCYIFRCSDINLNMTLRCIRTGIPLRAFEIMGSGGFLLTNYQADFLDYFEPGVDFAYYDSYEDLMEKTAYYLEHEEERKAIARNGYEKVKNYHTYRNRLDTMLEVMNINRDGAEYD